MKKLIMLAIGAAGCVLAAPCTSAPLSSYLTTGFTCTMDAFTLQDFFFQATASSGYTPLTASSITMTPLITPGPSGDKLGLSITSSGFSVTSRDFVTYDIRYNIDPPPDIIIGMDDDLLTNTPVAPGFVNVVTDLCIGGQWSVSILSGLRICGSPGTTASLNVFHNGTPTGTVQLFDGVTFPGVHLLGIDNKITLNANGASSQIRGLTNTTLTAPEPATAGLLLAGFGLMAFRRFSRKAD
jgi:hypothetical protein